MVSITDALVHCLQITLSDRFGCFPVGSSVVYKVVEFCSDNKAVVEVLRSGTSRDSNLMVLLRHLSLLAARHSFVFTARHVPGKSNAIADAISRFEFQRFHQLAPYASPTATPVPPYLLWSWPSCL